uniref:WD repeat-containing protein 18 n=1 Tax=Lygus hesperus TaxID=30085 RepID=A0A146L9R1_LYGHE
MECVNAIVCTTMDQTNPATIWDSKTGTLIAHFRGKGSIPRHCISISGGYLYASERGKPLIHCWPLNKQHCESRRLIAPGKIECFDFSPDSTHAAVAVSEKLHLYQLSSGRLLGIGAKHYQPISVVKFNDTNNLIACGGLDGMITVWTLANLIQGSDPLFSSMDHNLPISDLTFTSGSLRSRVLSVSADFSCKIFEVASGKLLLSIAFPARPTCLALAPNETAVFIGNSEGGIFEVNLFDKSRKTAEYHQPTEDQDSVFAGHEKQVSCIAVSRDSIYLISGSHDETVRVWHIESHQCVRKMSQRGAVTNLMFRVFSSWNFATGFKPPLVAHSFINPSNEEAHNDTSFEIMVKDDQLLDQILPTSSTCGIPQLSASVATPSGVTSSDQEAHLKLEIEKLKTVNNQMYRFAVKAILNGPSGVANDSVVPFSNVKVRLPNKKKKKVKGSQNDKRPKKDKTKRKKQKIVKSGKVNQP